MDQILKQEKHILLVLNELCHQLLPSGSDGCMSKPPSEDIDLLAVA